MFEKNIRYEEIPIIPADALHFWLRRRGRMRMQ